MYVYSKLFVCSIVCQVILYVVSSTVCSAPPPVEFKENNTIGETVTTISIQEGVSLNIAENPYNAFGINGSLLVANIVLDYEVIIPLRGVDLK